MPRVRPTLRLERSLLRAGARVLVGMDEVGRGALAGPVSVGAVAVSEATPPCPSGVADSKDLSAAAREALLPAVRTWGLARAVGHASAAEVDAVGIVGALRLAGQRALGELAAQVPAVDVVVLDGTYDWLTARDLFSTDDDGAWCGRVHTLAKADQACASVAAASILAKCERDATMVGLHTAYPNYGWDVNKGYGTATHLAAITAHGPSEEHRRTWRLPATAGDRVAVHGG